MITDLSKPAVLQINKRVSDSLNLGFLGDSSLDFLYYFAKEANETHPGLRKVEGSPIAGVSGALVLFDVDK